MKNSWLIWFIVVGVVITVLVAFNYQDEQGAIPLSEIFPEEEAQPVHIEYEFVDDGSAGAEKIVQKNAPAPRVVATQAEIVSVVDGALERREVAGEIKEQVVAEVAKKAEEIPEGNAQYTIQVASFKTMDRAEQKRSELTKKELDAYILSKDLAERGTWYRVYVGKYASKSEAGNSLANVREVVSDSFVISLK